MCSAKEEILGLFKKGIWLKEFDNIVFTQDLNKIHGPIKTQFGFI